MEAKHKELVLELTEKIQQACSTFLIAYLESVEEDDTSNLIDIIISSCLSACFNTMSILAKGNEEMERVVSEFIGKLTVAIGGIYPISNIEVLPKE